MVSQEEAVFARPSPQTIRDTWKSLFSDPLLSLSKLKALATTKAGLGEEDSDGGIILRSVYWRLYHGLLPPPTSQNLFAPALEISRATYTSLRRRYLIAPDGRWASDCSPDDPSSSSSSTPPAADSSNDAWDPLSLDGQSPWKTWFAQQDLRATIRQDVDRTFPDIEYFRSEGVKRRMVTMLFLFAVMNPDVGYRQGMHELLAVCLLAIDRDSLEMDTINTAQSSGQAIMFEAMRTTLDRRWVEHDAFGLFQEVMRGAKAFYEWRAEEGPRTKVPNAPQAPIILRCQHLHVSLLRRIDPQLWERFETEGLEPQIWAIRWIRLIFTRELPFSVAMRLWDGIFAEDPGLGLLDFMCIAMVLLIRNELLEADYSTMLTKLLRYPAPSTTYPLSPHLILAQALYLRSNVTPTGGVEIVLQNQDVLGVRAAPPERTDQESDTPRRLGQNRPAQQRPPPAQPPRPGVQSLAQGLFERAQAAGLDKTFYSTVADIRKNLPEGYSSYLPNLPFSPAGSTPNRDQFPSILTSRNALPQRSGFFGPLHEPVPASPIPPPPRVVSRPSIDSDISIKSLRDAERDLAEMRLAMMGMGKAMNEWMSALPIKKDTSEGDAWKGLGRVRDSLLDAAGSEVEDMVAMWGWHEGLEATSSRDELVPSIEAEPGILEESRKPDPPRSQAKEVLPASPIIFNSPETPKISSFPTAPRSAPLPADPRYSKPHLHLSSRDNTPSTGLSRTPYTAPIRDPLKNEAIPSPAEMGRNETRQMAGVSDPLAGLRISEDPLSEKFYG